MGDSSNKLRAGAEVTVVIERILPGGVGLAHVDERTLFVALAAPGDHVRVRVDQTRGKVAFASILEIINQSPVRVEPACAYFGRCGGCDFQQLDYKAQLDAKVEIIHDCLRRIAHLDYSGDIPITASPEPLHYRSSAQWQYDAQRRQLGYFERSSHTICDVVECPVLTPTLQKTLTSLRIRMSEGSLPHDAKEFQAVAGEEGVSLFPPIDMEETRDVSRTIRGDRYVFSANGFFQINHELLPELIYEAIRNANGQSEINLDETALDLYCGAGLFTVPLARAFKQMIGVEGNPQAVEYARRNLANANLKNAVIEHAAVGEWLRDNSASLSGIGFILLDPPRTGVEKGVLEGILKLHAPRITYVSCDPATLARDLRGLTEGGYKLDAITAFDMFPQTHHVETVAQLTLNQSG